MKNSNRMISTAVSSLLAFGVMAASENAMAAKKDVEKCYGVVKAGKNDCQTNTTSCAGTSTADAQGDAWVFVPKGLCEKLVDSSLKPKS